MIAPAGDTLGRLGEAVVALSTALTPPPSGTAMRDIPDSVDYTATCDRCGADATWRKGKDATKPTCTCTCSSVEGAA